MLHWMLSSGRRCVGAHVVGAYSAREPTIEQSVFGALPTHAAYNDRMQFAHLAEAWLLMRKHEELVNRKYTWVLRTRNDLVYRPDFIFQPGWLTTLPARSIAAANLHDVNLLGWPHRGIGDAWLLGARKEIMAVAMLLGQERSAVATKTLQNSVGAYQCNTSAAAHTCTAERIMGKSLLLHNISITWLPVCFMLARAAARLAIGGQNRTNSLAVSPAVWQSKCNAIDERLANGTIIFGDASGAVFTVTGRTKSLLCRTAKELLQTPVTCLDRVPHTCCK